MPVNTIASNSTAIPRRLKGTTSVQNVTNFSPITIKAENKSWVRVGGITGIMSGTSSLSGCVNKGNIYSKGTSTRAISGVNGADLSVIGGLVGFYESTHANAIKDSYNYGSIENEDPTVVCIGGLVAIASINKMKKDLSLTENFAEMGLGWLSREDKLEYTQKAKSVTVRLR